MTEAETLEILALFTANALTGFTLYASFTFAFLTATYFIGKELTRLQAIVVSFIYIFTAAASILTTVANLDAMDVLQRESANILSSRPLWSAAAWKVYMGTILALGMIASLVFLYDVRNNKGPK